MKRTRFKRKKPPTVALDKLLRQVILVRDGFKCVRCGKVPGTGGRTALQACHILPKGHYPSLRYELRNVICLCSGCHLFWWHKNPVEAMDWLQEKYGAQYVRELRELSKLRKGKANRTLEKIYLEQELQRLMCSPSLSA